jgi:anti-sigma B factor antagonist
MAFNVSSETTNGIAKITLSGELDAAAAPRFRDEVEKVSAQQPKRLVLLMQGLEYIASAGLRVLIFARQKMGRDVDIYVIAPQEQVKDTLEKTGFHHSVIEMDTYDAATIENI